MQPLSRFVPVTLGVPRPFRATKCNYKRLRASHSLPRWVNSETVNCHAEQQRCQRRTPGFPYKAGGSLPLPGSPRQAIMARMFTGLVEELATVEAARHTAASRRTQSLKLAVKAPL